MKTICRMISLVLISMFVFSLTSCSDHEEIVPEKKQSSIVVKILKSSVKYGEDDDEPLIIIPKVVGKVEKENGEAVANVNLKLFALPKIDFTDQTITATDGGFIFYNVKKGNYNLIVNSNGKVIYKKRIKL